MTEEYNIEKIRKIFEEKGVDSALLDQLLVKEEFITSNKIVELEKILLKQNPILRQRIIRPKDNPNIENIDLSFTEGYDPHDIRSFLSYACGMGYVHSDFPEDVFGEERDYYIKLALESWDANVHKKFMHETSPEFRKHNMTKDKVFCQKIAKAENLEQIRLATLYHIYYSAFSDIDTDHHSLGLERFSEIDNYKETKIVTVEELARIFPDLSEVLYDQATFIGRWFKEISLDENVSEKKVIETQESHRDRCIWIKDGKDIAAKVLPWPYNPKEVNSEKAKLIRNKLEKEKGKSLQGAIWEAWTIANNSFARFYIDNLMNIPLEKRFPASFYDVRRLAKF